ncbi:baculoviral IAP repeat-containing protein 3-like [Saccostrea cucullata]|uniref:baculoviral IAP repeat-containing protein 3-like n=1 Tax=Saccostrea cuccullata TaxID=36930 RepID=UPI002ED14C87
MSMLTTETGIVDEESSDVGVIIGKVDPYSEWKSPKSGRLTYNLSNATYTFENNLELVRLQTFLNFPASGYVSTIKLAKEGFYFTGDGDRVVCFACGFERSRWRGDDCPREIHRQISPNCPLLKAGPSNNVPIGDIPNGASTDQHIENPSQSRNVPNGTSLNNTNQTNANNEGAQRDRCLENVNNNASVTLPESAPPYRDNATVISSGSFNTTNTPGSALLNGSSQASSSKPSSENGANALPKKTDEHRNSTKTEANTVHSRSRNIQEKINEFDLDPLGINFQRPKYPAYAVLATRVSSYKDWPTSLTQTPRDLATAGFLYAGYGDYTRCFFCGGGLRNWEPGDDPWTEHARWFPKCAFLRQNKGDEFVALVQIEHQEEVSLLNLIIQHLIFLGKHTYFSNYNTNL